MRKLSAWIHSHPILAMMTAFTALFLVAHFFLNWRAERRWQAYAAAARARGVKLHLTDFERPEIPDAENFAALPMMRAVFSGSVKSPMALPDNNRPGFGDTRKGERMDWVKWGRFFKDAGFISETTDSPPRDVLRALEHYAPQFQEWSEWKTRPRCRFALDLKAGAAMPLSHLGSFQEAAKLFSLRMRAHLALGDSSAAGADFSDGFQAYRALVDEPTLICGLVRMSVLVVLIEGVGGGIADHAWAPSELAQIDADMAAIRVWEDYRLSFSSERGFANWTYETILKVPAWKRARHFIGLGGIWTGPGLNVIALIPSRIYRDNQLRANQHFDEMLARVSADGMRFDPDRAMPSGPENLSGFDNFYFFLFRVSAPSYGFIQNRFALLQTRLDQLHLAIAIERFRTARGAIPGTLAELVPDFIAELPQDIYTGLPMIYRRKESGGFLLYSVGPDRRDDGGAFDAKGSEVRQPDWVWLHSRD